MKKIRLLFLTLVALLGITSAAAKTVYLKPNSNWLQDNARFALYMYGGGEGDEWTDFTLVDAANNIYQATFNDSRTNMIFVRMNGSAPENNWSNKWNQTADLAAPTFDNELFTLGDGWDSPSYTTAYFVGFNTEITTGSPDFVVASNWGHLVDRNTYYDNHMSYSYTSTGGVGGSGALLGYNQLDYDYGQQNSGVTTNDLIVTPLVSGEVKLDVKLYDANGSVTFYKVTKEADVLTRGDEIAASYSGDLNQTTFVTATLNIAEETYIGIRIQNAYIDNFIAENATIIPEKKITIASAVPSDKSGTIYWDQQANGKVLVSYTVTVTNTGDVALTQGDENYSVSIINGSTKEVYATVPVPQNLAVDETSSPFEVSGEVETSLWPNSYTYINMDLKENLCGSTIQRAQSHYKAYEPKFVFREAGSSSSSSISSAEAWGTIRESTTKNYEIANTGIAPLTINSIEIPEGFKSSSPSSVVLERAGEYDANDAIWAAWTWDTDRNAGEWVVEDEGKFTGQIKKYVTFVRMNPEADDIPGWGAAWNQTEDLVINPGMTTYVIDSWKGGADDKLGGHWKAITLAKGETKAISITNDASVTGTYAGNLVIKYLDKEAVEQTYELAFSTTVIGANTWTADFNNTTSTVAYPAGSIAENGIRTDYNYNNTTKTYDFYLKSYTSSSYATENNKFITPKLHAAAGDKLTFDVRRDDSSSSTYNLKVYVSTDRKTWGDPVYSVTAADLTSAYQTKEISFDVTDDYYVAFAIYGVRVDNLVGLTKVDVAHDLYIKSVSWPEASIKSGTAQSKPSVDIIPLTTETAETYSVKYVCGETVLAEGTPIAMTMTASANSSKSFSFSWTPEVESTTTFSGTKVVFEFTDGTKFETETFDLTVTNEPIFHFVKTLPSSKWYEPSDYTTPITFGKTNSADTQTFYINNWGSAQLKVKSITLPAGFTTSVETPLTIAAFNGENDGIAAASQALDIIFSATEAGEYSGDIVITYVNAAGEDASFTIAISGTKLDPTKWYANFNDEAWPAGSVYQDNVSISYINTGDYGLMSSSSTKNLFITPKLTAVAGDVLQFDASTRNSYYDGTVKVYIGTDRENFGDAVKEIALSKTDNVSKATYEYSFASAGDYYVAFELSEARVDDIYGLKLAEVAHDWKIASSNIPAEGMQNYTSTATVNVLNLGIADEAADSYTVTAYVNGVAAGTGEAVAIPMNHKLSDTGTQLSVSYMSNKVGTFPVYLEVKAGDYSVQTDPVNVTFAEEVAISGIQVGTKSTTSSSVPFYTSWMDDGAGKSMSDFIYTPEQLAAFGITAGAKITSIKFVGNPSGSKTISSLTTDVWVAQQSVASFTAGSPDKGSMTHVNIHNAESVTFTSGSAYEFNIDLTENPIVYDGTSGIRIYTNINGSGQYQSINFDIDNNYKNAYYAHGTGAFSSVTGNPVAFFNLAVETATLSGTVKNSSSETIEGATVTLKADNGVEYSGTTAADGSYSINVIQAGLDFTATVEKDGYLKKQFAYNLGGASQTLNVDLYTQMGIVGTFPGFNWTDDQVMTQSTEDPNIFTLTVEGVTIKAITYEYKLRADGKWGAYDKPAGGDPAANGNGNYEFGFGTTMYPAGTYNLIFTANTTDHTLTLQPVLQLTLADSQTPALNYENAPADVTVGRTLKAGWNAMVLPFDVTAEEIAAQFGANAQVAEFTGDEQDGDKVSVNFAKSDVITANVPFLLYLEAAPGEVKFLNKSVTFAAEPKVAGTKFDFVGLYADGTSTTIADGDYIMAGGMLKCAAGGNAINAYRSYLKLKEAPQPARISIFMDGELIGEAEGTGEATGINGIGVKQVDGLYNMGGQKVTGRTKKGVYIQNGKKVVIK